MLMFLLLRRGSQPSEHVRTSHSLMEGFTLIFVVVYCSLGFGLVDLGNIAMLMISFYLAMNKKWIEFYWFCFPV